MPDLNTENPHVVNTLYRWINHLVQTYQIDAIRIDTVKHVRKDFWPGFVQAGGVAAIGEVLHGGQYYRAERNVGLRCRTDMVDPMFLGPYQKQSVPSLLDFANYYALKYVSSQTDNQKRDFKREQADSLDGSSSRRHPRWMTW